MTTAVPTISHMWNSIDLASDQAYSAYRQSRKTANGTAVVGTTAG